MNRYKKIGVMGGMGPETSAAFYQHIIKLFQTAKGARHNYEFPEMLVHNVPSPDNVEAGVDERLLSYMIESAKLLEKAGMDFITIPCNSAHVHIEAVSETVRIPILNILEETARVVAHTSVRRVLVLGTKSTLGYGLYPPYLEARNIEAIEPGAEAQQAITEIIMHVCEGTVDDTVRARLAALIASIPRAEGVILGCTELPLAVKKTEIPIPIFDTLEILVRSTFNLSVGENVGDRTATSNAGGVTCR